MKYIAICPSGLEDITQKEIKEILKVRAIPKFPGRILFETDHIQKLIKKTQSIMKIYEYKQYCLSHKDIKAFSIASPFRVVCSRQGGYVFSSQEVEKEVGAKFFAEGNTVNLKNPKTIVFVDILNEAMYVGIDLTPELLSRRKYRVKIHNQSINACIAYGLVRLSGYGSKKLLLDPFCRDGIIPIEAALYKNGKIFAYDSLFPNVRSTEINATLAHVRKKIKISRIEVEWLDTKFGEGEIDCIATAVPFPSKTQNENEVRQFYKDFFYHVSFILKKGGKAVCIAPRLDLFKNMLGDFKIIEEREVSTSKLCYSLLVFKR